MNREHTCPVCGYQMPEPPEDFNICSCCGTEFGYHDANASIKALRANWLKGGLRWWSQGNPPPAGWDPYSQVSDLVESSLHGRNQVYGSEQPLAPKLPRVESSV